ncbi:hypothetical protein [Nocardioides sp. LHG3406-4]|uniref:hypothetical protein n=1 Tax=Nocardioides sp. LHG3406-4 TaxID=2804575 RepID=UPI003CFAF7EE
MLRLPEADAPPAPRVGGLLAAYVVVHAILILHGLGLTLAALIVNAHPSLGGLDEPKPWSHIAFYVATNVVLAVYSAVLIRLILARRRSAIVHNGIWAILTVVFLVTWHVLGMKSQIGVVVDSLPGLVGTLYLARSSRVKKTLVTRRVS